MLLKLLLLIALLSPQLGFANITASVVKFKGEVLYNGRQISNGTKFINNGLIEVRKGYLKMKVDQYNSTFSLGANSTLKIKFNKDIKNSPYTILNGLLRWVTKKGKAKVKGFVRTRSASLAVRGTDFLVVVSDLLKETEVYCFKGKVLFQNRKDRKDRGLVAKNDWGGIGGRFGEDVGAIIPMTNKQITHVKSLLE